VKKSAAKRRKAAADVTLSLYAMMKSLERIGLVGKQGVQLGNLRKLLTTHRVPAALKVTKKDAKAVVTKAKAAKVLKQSQAKVAKARAKAAEVQATTQALAARAKAELGL
jgi:hypothetical protein